MVPVQLKRLVLWECARCGRCEPRETQMEGAETSARLLSECLFSPRSLVQKLFVSHFISFFRFPPRLLRPAASHLAAPSSSFSFSASTKSTSILMFSCRPYSMSLAPGSFRPYTPESPPQSARLCTTAQDLGSRIPIRPF
ncbi:hypothetical protein HETIRDRAFT_439780 [Heterobasidion irregulare TC 32-1]|uniref:Uncharacterized protein n=1 Tax=Heterobasidion irregulare (strain TC 32-1) TaxID=747525 RepID=W4KCD3_HETIT|nr:uncharacterized protein HETIRDRAFT_439780 [Heterobasidion irregulare TC 32-1]ETW83428.1 hypothetical protein HETIRDRAFT_439780 [Heterobasidion irregulare TC 32-1]